MAVVKNASSSRMILKVQTGVETEGKPVFKNRVFANVKAVASNQDVYDVAVALGGLQRYAVDAILREDHGQLTEA